MGKAKRRLKRGRQLKAGGKRIFIGGIMPVATYAAEHSPWKPSDVTWLQSAALDMAGVKAPGVPNSVLMETLPAKWDAAFRIPMAALERLHREIWISTGPESKKPKDALSGEELYLLHRALGGGAGRPECRVKLARGQPSLRASACSTWSGPSPSSSARASSSGTSRTRPPSS